MKTVTQALYPLLFKHLLVNCHGSIVKKGLIFVLMYVNYQPISKMKIINKIFAHIKQNNCCVRYQKLGNESDLHIIYSDAAHGNLPNGRSQDGYVIFLCGHNRMCSPLNWQSKRI